jgi:hypothetical protein
MQATEEQIAYVLRTKGYLDEAFACARSGKTLWRLGVVALGSALESLLRLKYGQRPKDLFTLIDQFDKDSCWDGMQLHPHSLRQCATCSLDAIRKQRNSVHPHLWSDSTEREFGSAAMQILVMQHMLVYCESRIADFPDDVAFPDVFSTGTEEETAKIIELLSTK